MMAEVIDLTTNSDTEAAATSYTQTWHPPQQFPPLQFTSAPSIQLQTPHAAFEKAHHGLSIQPRSLPRAPSSTHRPISAVEHYRRQSAEQALRRKHSSRSISPEQSRKRQRLDPAILSSSPALQHRENGSPKSKDDGLQFLAAGEVRQSKTDICSSSPVPVEAGFTESKRDRRMRRSWKKIVLPSMREAFVPHLERLDKHIRREIQCKVRAPHVKDIKLTLFQGYRPHLSRFFAVHFSRWPTQWSAARPAEAYVHNVHHETL